MKRPIPIVLVAVATLLSACGGTSSSPGASAVAPQVSPPPSAELLTDGALSIGSDISYPPQESYKLGTKIPEGFDVDLGNAIGAKMGLQVDWINQTFNGIIPALTSKKFDIIISAMTINADRQQKVDFIPYFKAGESFVVLKGSSKHPTKIADLCGLSVAVESGTAEESESMDANDASKQGPCASNKIKLQSFQVDTEALNQLTKGTVDVHFTDSPVAGYEIAHHNNLQLSGGVIEVAPEGIAVRKGDTAIENPVMQAFKAIEDDGTYANLLKKWGLEGGDIRKA
jgi:polar amino acid transport system substrate-binding protein